MDGTIITDLKQFITATVSQHTTDLATKDDIARLDKKIDDRADEILAAVGETMTVNTEAVDQQLADHKRRLTKLEPHHA